MKVRWNNLIVFALLITSTILATKYWQSLKQVLSTIPRITSGHSFEERIIGVIVLGILGVCLVVMVRILSRKQ